MWSYNDIRIKPLMEKIDTFKTAGPGTTRLPFSKEEMEARAFIIGHMEAIGLTVTTDSIGNICGRLPGTNPSIAPVWTGSHIDTVLEAGMFDGVAGVVAGLEAARIIKEYGVPHKRDICVWVYTSEESTRFQMGCIGSRAMAGHLTREELSRVKDSQGTTLEELLLQRGFQLDEYTSIEKHPGDVYAAIELHIEQSASLEHNQKQIGIVDAICAPSNLILTLEGEQSHAGGTSMEKRKDAFMAASEISLALERCALHGTSSYTTGTVGFVEITPNAVNVIPGKVTMSVDVRDCDYQSKNKVVKTFLAEAASIAKMRKVRLTVEEKCNDMPMKCDTKIRNLLHEICEKNQMSYMHTISGAYHDSIFIGQFAPVGMIFVPSKNGISHSPAEWTDFEDIKAGTSLLIDALIGLANEEESNAHSHFIESQPAQK